MIKHFSVAPSKHDFVQTDPQILLQDKVCSWADTSDYCKQDPTHLFPVWDVALWILGSKTVQKQQKL